MDMFVGRLEVLFLNLANTCIKFIDFGNSIVKFIIY
jgi:hypothetical protein